jgi:DNA-binding Lrp family transcriptional regulator
MIGKSELLTMSQKEIKRLEILEKISAGKITQIEAAEILGISTRQIRRQQRKHEKEGAAALVSKKRGAPSNNQLATELKNTAIELIKIHYYDFGPTLVQEKLIEQHQLQISVESVRQLMMKEGLWKGKKKRAAAIHQMRSRRSCLGELVQIDGSPHAWFEDRGPVCCLLVFVDDATGKIMQLHFEENESTQGYFDATYQYVQQHGLPCAFYSDKHGIFRVNAKEAERGTGETQYSRALKTLDITLIHANSPQAKGRVENKNGTLQDRLVKELRLQQINDIESANAFLPRFIKDYNKRFAKSASKNNLGFLSAACCYLAVF